MIYDVITIGGGPAGMIAAGRAGERGARSLLFEKNNQLGLKLLATGHGRCNLTNTRADKKETMSIYGKNFKFLFSAFNKFGVQDTLEFFAKLGLMAKEENRGRVFPRSDQSSDVLQALTKYLKQNRVEVKFGVRVKEIMALDNKIAKAILNDGQEYMARNFIISTGGQSYPETGSTGDGYGWLKSLGHKIISPRPALAPIIVKEKIIKSLEGLSLKKVGIEVYQNDKKITGQAGEIIFTADGLSGPAAIDLSGRCGAPPPPVYLKLDFMTETQGDKLEKKLQTEFHQAGSKTIKNYLAEIMSEKLAWAIIAMAGVKPDKPASVITKAERLLLRRAIKEFTLTISRLADFGRAMVTAGGVEIKEVEPKTMRSRLYENLFLAGEILDLDGPSGGYNLQLCWSTGYVAGDSASF